MGCVEGNESEDQFTEMNWHISRSSGLIQLSPVLPLEILYQIGHGSGSTGALWDAHHSAFASFIHEFSPRSVLEIGGCHGILAKKFHSFAEADWTIIEPNPMPVAGVPAKIIQGFFDESFIYEEPYDCLVHSHVLEHIYEPDQFMRHLAGFISEGKHIIFSVPNMEVMLMRKYTNCINFEHTIFLTEPYIDFLLVKHGFRLLRKEYFLEDHSIFYAAVRDRTDKSLQMPSHLYEYNQGLYREYVRHHLAMITRINHEIRATNKPVYLFGAHVFSQYLFAFGLKADNILSLLDNDPLKQGKRLYGTSLKVASPKILRNIANPLVILKAGVYNNEVRQDILTNINPGTVFIE